MNQALWLKVEELFHAALERPPEERPAFLDRACNGDTDLRRQVELLLAKEDQAGSFLEVPAIEDQTSTPTAAGSLLGRQFGPYRILSPLGAGGMGEVYRAHDDKLRRDVAIKVIPAAFVHDPDRLTRFQREARMLASLNHPNIATIYGLEHSDDVHYLVMELVPGRTLAERVSAGPAQIKEALAIAGQIAEALEAAHDKGVIHRDLKPANVKLTPEGRVKVLDFGLAKAFAGDGEQDLSQALTAMGTEEGRILGTPAYMSPEQARGNPVDKRTDVWAFGCVLYELFTGRRAFQGETLSDTIAAVLEREPDWQALPPATPAKIRDLLRRCMQKDKTLRLRDTGDAAIEIHEALASPPTAVAATAAPATTRGWREQVAWMAAAVFILTTIASIVGYVLRAPKPQQIMRMSTEIGVDASLYTPFGPSAILSPDGMRLAFVAAGSDQRSRIYVRSLDALQAAVLSGTENARDPFFSPDGQWIPFFADDKLKKIAAQGGAAVTLCDAPNDRGGSWGDDGTIVFSKDNGSALYKVSSTAGTPQPMTSLDTQAGEVTQCWPQVLPGSKAVLFTSSTHPYDYYDDANIIVYSPSGQRKIVQRGGFYARYLPSGHLVYMHENTLFAAPFDLQRLEATGQSAAVLEGVAVSPDFGGAQFSFSDSGNLVYVAGGGGRQKVSIYWMDREGKFTPLRDIPGDYANPEFSPDGKRLTLNISPDGRRTDIWVYEWERDTLTRLTFAGDTNIFPVWTPDGRRIVYSSQENGGPLNLWWIRADGAGNAQRLAESNSQQFAWSWRPDGKVLAFSQANPGTNWNIMTLSIEGDEKSGSKPGEPKPFVNSPFSEAYPAFSPDGRWLAYMSTESGNFEVYVRPFPGPGGKWQVSTGGGSYPKWSRNGRELFYRTAASKIMVLTYTASGDSFRADKPQLWSPGQFTSIVGVSNFDLHPDGKRFAVLKAPNAEHNSAVNKVSFIFNFFDEIGRKVPPGK